MRRHMTSKCLCWYINAPSRQSITFCLISISSLNNNMEGSTSMLYQIWSNTVWPNEISSLLCSSMYSPIDISLLKCNNWQQCTSVVSICPRNSCRFVLHVETREERQQNVDPCHHRTITKLPPSNIVIPVIIITASVELAHTELNMLPLVLFHNKLQ